MPAKPWEVFDRDILPHLNPSTVFHNLTDPRKSIRAWRATCPFDPHHHRSLLINPKNLIWYCEQGCGGGGPVEYVRKQHGCSWLEAAQILAESTGRELIEPSAADERWTEPDFTHCIERYQRYVLTELFSRHTQKLLLSDRPDAEKSRAFLKKRGFSLEVIKFMSFGLYTSQEDMAEFFERHNHLMNTGLALGLLRPDWVGRITGQWRDINGRVINLWGRFPGKAPYGHEHYVTLSRPWPDQPFGSVSTPFNLDRAARAGKRDLILMESPLKALLPYTLGLGFKIGPFPIASTGHLIEKQKDILSRYLGAEGSLTLCLNYDPKTYGTERDRTMEIVKKLGDVPYRLFTVDPILMAKDKVTDPMQPDTFILTHGGQVHGLETFVSILARCPGLDILRGKSDDVDAALTRYIEKDLWGKWSSLVEDELLEP